MTTYEPRKLGQGFVRDTDGILVWQGGRHYQDPGEAVKTWWAGEVRCGCTEPIPASYSSSPCGKTAKYDPDANGRPTKCGRHSAAAKVKRKAAQEERDRAWRAKWDSQRALSTATAALEPALRKIAEGHNDARGLAQEVIAALDAAKRL